MAPIFILCTLTDSLQMARKMDFSVVGLPHYTIWHLYEPSVDDIKHMEVRSSKLMLESIIIS